MCTLCFGHLSQTINKVKLKNRRVASDSFALISLIQFALFGWGVCCWDMFSSLVVSKIAEILLTTPFPYCAILEFWGIAVGLLLELGIIPKQWQASAVHNPAGCQIRGQERQQKGQEANAKG